MMRKYPKRRTLDKFPLMKKVLLCGLSDYSLWSYLHLVFKMIYSNWNSISKYHCCYSDEISQSTGSFLCGQLVTKWLYSVEKFSADRHEAISFPITLPLFHPRPRFANIKLVRFKLTYFFGGDPKSPKNQDNVIMNFCQTQQFPDQCGIHIVDGVKNSFWWWLWGY